MRKNTHEFRTFVGDFETTVFPGQAQTEVWAAALVEINTENVMIFHSLRELWEHITTINDNVQIYYHNLKFDGSFWLPFLMQELKFKQAIIKTGDDEFDIKFLDDADMPANTFKYSISDQGEWYKITIKYHKHYIYIVDSFKLIPCSVKKIGEGFETKHRKREMQYVGFRYAGCEITPEEQEYIKNDVLVVKEALEFMFRQGHNRLTIGACCMTEYKTFFDGNKDFYEFFPRLDRVPVDITMYGSKNAFEYIRKSYRGGWCYVVPQKRQKVYKNGTTADVNSLYPSMMHSMSGNVFPVGYPTFWHGNYIPVCCNSDSYYYFVRIKCEFDIKPHHLPCIQIKGNFNYPSNAWLITSKIYNSFEHRYYEYYIDEDGVVNDASVVLTLTKTDYELIQEQYDLKNIEILDGCYFHAVSGIFDDYIDKYAEIKQRSTGAMREISKLFLVNLYGQMGKNTNSSFKYAIENDDKSLTFVPIEEEEKVPGYIAAGSAITSYARNFTIRAAQANYHGFDKPGFIYADTDSIHCDVEPQYLNGINIDPVKFCHWKIESQWEDAWFVRAKTYIEHVVSENLEPVVPWYNIKCAGMGDVCKNLFIKSLVGYKLTTAEREKLTPEQIAFVEHKHTYRDFKPGLRIFGEKTPKRIRGGIILVDDYYTMQGAN